MKISNIRVHNSTAYSDNSYSQVDASLRPSRRPPESASIETINVYAKKAVVRKLANPSSVPIKSLLTEGDKTGRLKQLYNSTVLIGNNTLSDEDYQIFAERVEGMFSALYTKSVSFHSMIDSMNYTAREKLPAYSESNPYKHSIIVFDYDHSYRKRDGVAGYMNGWRSYKGFGRRDSVRTDAKAAPGTVSIIYLSSKNGLDPNKDKNLETVAHEITHAYQYFHGIVAPDTDMYIDLNGFSKSTGNYLVEFETVGSLYSPSAYSEMTVMQDLGIKPDPTYRSHTPQEFLDKFQKADPESYLKYTNSTKPYGVKDFGFVTNKNFEISTIIEGTLGLVFFAGIITSYVCLRHHHVKNDRPNQVSDGNSP